MKAIISDKGKDLVNEIKDEFASFSIYENNPYLFPNMEYKYDLMTDNGYAVNGFGDKLNFLGIQLLAMKSLSDNAEQNCQFDKFYSMLVDICHEKLELVVELDGNLNIGNSISSARCLNEIFESKKSLFDFLVNSESYLKGE